MAAVGAGQALDPGDGAGPGDLATELLADQGGLGAIAAADPAGQFEGAQGVSLRQ